MRAGSNERRAHVDSDGSLVLPGAFLPAAERFHSASRIDCWVLTNVIAWLQAQQARTHFQTLSVNLSGQSVSDRSFHRWALDVINHAGPEICSILCLELTETAAVTNLSQAGRFIEQVRSSHVKVALDDFGAGASWFGYLKTLNVDFLKIDGQFIRDLIDNPLNDVTVRCFAEVAKVIGVETVAEVVEDRAIWNDSMRLALITRRASCCVNPCRMTSLPSFVSREHVSAFEALKRTCD